MLVGPLYKDYSRYRMEEIRIICEIKEQKLIILVVEMGHRKEIYR